MPVESGGQAGGGGVYRRVRRWMAVREIQALVEYYVVRGRAPWCWPGWWLWWWVRRRGSGDDASEGGAR